MRLKCLAHVINTLKTNQEDKEIIIFDASTYKKELILFLVGGILLCTKEANAKLVNRKIDLKQKHGF